MRGSRGKLCNCRLVVEVRVILFSLLFTGRIERGFFTVLMWCMRVSNTNPSRGSPVIANHGSLTGDCSH